MPDLREKSFGVAGGRPSAWLDERWVLAPDSDDRMDHFEGVEGGETRRQLLTRISRAMAEINVSDCRTQVVVTHGLALTRTNGSAIGRG